MQAQSLRTLRHALAIFLVLGMSALGVQAAPYASMVMDARNGEVIFARNHDTKLHPASLTKMMTIYVAFEAIKHGEVTLDTQFTVSQRAAGTTCVCLGLRAGQRISLRYLIRAAALRSANDASVVIAEGISGSVEEFAKRMTRTARAMGMNNTTFRNPHGLTQTGHVSTARDMTILGRQLYFDYPQYFNIFSRRSDHAGVSTVPNTNRRFLDAYQGADGIKTGFTRAAGFNLTASAKRGGKHIIATMFGGSSAAARNAHVAELMDIGFRRAPSRVAISAPRTPAYQGRVAVAQASAAPARNGEDDPSAAARTIRLQMAVRRSLRPQPRPESEPDDTMLMAVRDSVDAVVTELAQAPQEAPVEEGDELAGVAPEALPVTPPARPEALAEARAPEGPERTEDAIAEALAVGFARALPESLEPEESAEAENGAGERAEADPAELERAEVERMETESAAPEMVEMAASAPPPARAPAADPAPDQGADVGPEAAVEVEEAIAEAVDAALPEASETAQAADAEMTWIGADASFLKDVSDPKGLLPEPISATVQPEPSQPVEEESGIILTSTAADLRREVGEQAIARVVEAHLQSTPAPAPAPQVVSRLSTSDTGRIWGVSLGQFNSRAAAERSLITVKMAEANSLGNGVSRIRQTSGRFEASFAGLTQLEAERACLRLQARAMECAIARP